MSTTLPRPCVARYPRAKSCSKLLDRCVEDARIHVVCEDGAWTVGAGGTGGTAGAPNEATIEVREPRFFGRVLGYANLGLGESFMDGDYEVPGDGLPDLLTILVRANLERKLRGDWRLSLRAGSIGIANRVVGPWRNVARHFDVGDDLFESFLDPTLTYTCGYARDAADDLETLQRQKLDRICAKLRLRAGPPARRRLRLCRPADPRRPRARRDRDGHRQQPPAPTREPAAAWPRAASRAGSRSAWRTTAASRRPPSASTRS